MHHKVKLQLDAICQEAGDMNVEEFMQVYESLKPITIGSIGKIPLTKVDEELKAESEQSKADDSVNPYE